MRTRIEPGGWYVWTSAYAGPARVARAARIRRCIPIQRAHTRVVHALLRSPVVVDLEDLIGPPRLAAARIALAGEARIDGGVPALRVGALQVVGRTVLEEPDPWDRQPDRLGLHRPRVAEEVEHQVVAALRLGEQ